MTRLRGHFDGTHIVLDQPPPAELRPNTSVEILVSDQREKELQALLATEAGRKELQDQASRYAAMCGKLRPAGKSAITYILVYEREQGLIRS